MPLTSKMKINEKNLCSYSISPANIDKEGYLLKRGEINKSFQKRWFVLKGNLLFYFEKRTDSEPVGVIILEGCTIELAESEDQYSFKIVFYGIGCRTYVFAADSQESLESWMKALACASYDYLKLIVVELQKQLDEINESEQQATGNSAKSESGSVPPPTRCRENPFNRPDISMSYGDLWDLPQCKVTNLSRNSSSASSSSVVLPVRPAPPPPMPGASGRSQHKSFSQLHSEYGVPILRDKELYFKGTSTGVTTLSSGNPDVPVAELIAL